LDELLTITVKTFSISTKQKKVLTVMVYNSTNIIKPKESFSSDGEQFYQYQHTKRKFIKQRLSTIPPISTKQKNVLTVMVNNSITLKTFLWFVDIGGIVDHHC
jgi:hypothetical protein